MCAMHVYRHTHMGHVHIINGEKITLPPERDNGGANQGALCQSARVRLLCAYIVS